MIQRRILVVDDVESNLLVTKALLTPYKISVETLQSGIEAIEKIKAGEKYDIIFMDHLMPDMDGIVTTKIIRDIGYNNPIVALTGSTTKKQSELFMSNGFSCFISKPIDIECFDACLRRFIPEGLPNLEELLAQAKEEEEDELRKTSYAFRLAESFIRDATNAINTIEPIMVSGFEFNDDAYKRYKTAVHSMKTALANVDEANLAAESHSLEQAAENKDLSIILSKTPQFLIRLQKAVEERRPKEVSDIPDFDTEFLHTKLQQIADACQVYDIMTVEETMDELKEKNWSIATSKLISKISEALLHGDYEKAGELGCRYFPN